MQCAISESGVTIHAGADERWDEYASARFDQAGATPAPIDLAALRERCREVLPHDLVYSTFARRGLQYGPSFTGITDARVGPGEALAALALPSAAGSADGYLAHPALLDAAFQLLDPCCGWRG